MNFYCHLKKHKKLVIQGTQKGGIPIYNGSPKPITPETDCDEVNGFERNFVTPFILTLTWDDEKNNGILNAQLDEYYGGKYNRSLGVASATSNAVDINEVDGIEAVLTYNNGRFFLNRDRDYRDRRPETNALHMFSSDGKRIKVEERNEILKCGL
jgi:hypothetical protein